MIQRMISFSIFHMTFDICHLSLPESIFCIDK